MAYKVGAFKDKCDRKFTLEQILSNDEAWVDALSQQVWERVRSAPVLKQIRDVHRRLGKVEGKLARLDDKMDLLLCQRNGGRNE